MAKPYIIFFLLFSICSCSSPWLKFKDGKTVFEKYLITNLSFPPYINSESGALDAALTYSGYNINEPDILGGGGIDCSIQKGEFPILSFSSPEMITTFLEGAKIPFQHERPENALSSWTGVKKILSEGLPVILRVDSRWLVYRYSGKPGPFYSADGRHYVTLFGIDTLNNYAWVSDAPYRELQMIDLEDLDNARGSALKAYPPEREYYWIPRKRDVYRYDWKEAADTALSRSISNMECPVATNLKDILSFQGIKAVNSLSNEIYLFEKRISFYGLLQTVFYTLYADISRDDGAALRIFLGDFLNKAYINTKDPRLRAISASLYESAAAWKELALEFRKISVNIKDFKNISERRMMYKRASKLAGKVSTIEKDILRLMKNYLSPGWAEDEIRFKTESVRSRYPFSFSILSSSSRGTLSS
jgi:hypothetical protein